MRRVRGRVILALAAFAVAAAATAAVTPVKVYARWTGRVPQGVAPPLQASLTTAEALQVVWTLCQVKGTPPAIDFSKQLVVLAVRTGTTVRFQNVQLVDGDLRANVVVTRDAPARTNCALARVDGAGVKGVNGLPPGH